MKSKIFLIIITVTVAVGGGLYAWLGGFKDPEFEIVKTTEQHIAGRYFEGTIRDEAFGKLFQEVAKLQEENKLPGELGSIYYNNPEEGTDSIKAFIGVVVPDKNVALPQGYELRTVPGGQQALQGKIEAHYALAPGKLYSALFEHAKENNIKLQTFYVERFPSSHEMLVQVPIAGK